MTILSLTVDFHITGIFIHDSLSKGQVERKLFLSSEKEIFFWGLGCRNDNDRLLHLGCCCLD